MRDDQALAVDFQEKINVQPEDYAVTVRMFMCKWDSQVVSPHDVARSLLNKVSTGVAKRGRTKVLLPEMFQDLKMISRLQAEYPFKRGLISEGVDLLREAATYSVDQQAAMHALFTIVKSATCRK